MEMIEYKPWSKDIADNLIKQSNKNLPILDIQLGGACNLNCIYCDTPKYGVPCFIDLTSIEKIMGDGNIEWVYVCGLGEPTAPANIQYLKQILYWCKKKKIKLSMFSNMLNIDKDLLDYIDDGILHVLFKLDTFDKEKMVYLYGKDKGDIILKNYRSLEEVLHTQNDVTNLGASIVPTSVNYDELPKVIDYCMTKGIFPLIGQLEDAGSCSQLFDKLEVKEKDLLKLRKHLEQTYGVNYEIPICPATISGVHVANTNKVILDERTGLSCPWFWLDEPKMIEIGNIKDMDYSQIVESIMQYRNEKFEDVVLMEKNVASYPFGGCGGDAKRLLKTYVDLNRK